MTNDQQLKSCPLCGEEIKTFAKKCKHCKEFLTDIPSGALTDPVEPTELKNESETQGDKDCGEANVIRKIHDLELVAIFCILGVGINGLLIGKYVTGALLILFSISDYFDKLPRILQKNRTIPNDYKSLGSVIFLIIIMIWYSSYSLLLFIALRFYIRSLVLDNKKLFTESIFSQRD